MILHLILPGEWSISHTPAPRTSFEITPIHCWSRCMCSIVMSPEIVPPAESKARTLRVVAFEDVDIWRGCGADRANHDIRIVFEFRWRCWTWVGWLRQWVMVDFLVSMNSRHCLKSAGVQGGAAWLVEIWRVMRPRSVDGTALYVSQTCLEIDEVARTVLHGLRTVAQKLDLLYAGGQRTRYIRTMLVEELADWYRSSVDFLELWSCRIQLWWMASCTAVWRSGRWAVSTGSKRTNHVEALVRQE
jgi:hypothetical protein